MIIWLSFIIPILSSIILLLFWHKVIAWWELVIKLVVVFFVILLVKCSSTAFMTDVVEYWTYHATEVWHEDPWDEWISETCTESYSCGTDSKGNTQYCTRTYDCSYRKHHDDEYYFVDHYKIKHNIYKAEYYKYKKMWGNSTVIDMKRDYYQLDGDAQRSKWDNQRTSIRIFVNEHNYENRIKASNNVFNYEKIEEADAHKRGLFDYPESKYEYTNSVLDSTGFKWIYTLNKDADYTNGILGPKKQVRLWYLIFKDKPRIVGHWQEAYWKGGNKNEFVICISLDKTGKVQWCHVFSWTDNKNTVVKVNSMIANQTIFSPVKTNIEVEKILGSFERKNFEDFSYLEIEPTTASIIWSYIFVILTTIGISVWIVWNDIDENTKL